MTPRKREERLTVRLSAEEAARLDEMRSGGTRQAAIRALICEARATPPRQDPTYDEALHILAAMAREGRVAAAVALERALRDRDDTSLDGELERILRVDP